MAKQKFNVIKKDTIINIEVSGGFYMQIRGLMLTILDMQPDIKQALINIDTPETVLTVSEASVQAFMMLVKSIEDAARKDGSLHTEEIEVDIPEDDETNPSES